MKVDIRKIKVEKRDGSNLRRVRKQLGNVAKLASSISRHGILHPITVEAIGKDEWMLIAGERRLRACILNGMREIDVNLITDVDEIAKKEIELEENIMRSDLHWSEECEALRQLNDLKRQKYGAAMPGSIDGWRLADTADSVGMSKTTATIDVKLAKDLSDNPSLMKKVAKLPKTAARKIVKQTIEADMLRRRVERNEIAISNSLLLGDACTLIDKLQDGSVNLLITDPPFAVDEIEKVAAMGMMTYNKMAKTNVDTREHMQKVYDVLLPKIFNKLAEGAHIYVFLAMDWYPELIRMLRDVGFVVDGLPLIWNKCRPSVMAKDMHYTSSYEAILFGHKPPRGRILSNPISNVLSIPTISPQSRVHPLQKPFDLLKIFIENSSDVGEVVLDCFAGSASTLVAAQRLQRSAIGYEIDEGNYLRAQEFMGKECE